jgi:hypothetical protein
MALHINTLCFQVLLAFQQTMLRPAGPGEPRLQFYPSQTPPSATRRRWAPIKGPDAPKRQTASDQRWEGEAWLSSADLAQNIEKKSKFHEAFSPTCLPPDMPPRPKDPAPPKDASSRRRDKDRIPAREVYVPDLTTKTWVLVPQPVLLQVGIFRVYKPLPPQQLTLLRRLVDLRVPGKDGTSVPVIDTEFLKNHLVPRLNRDHPASLRTLDWLVVDYAREKGVAYTWTVFGTPRVVVVHHEYTQYLAVHRRRHFDVFRRRHRVYFDVDGQTYSTTAAQLHFFHIAFNLGFLQYAERASADIKAHMKAKLTENAAAKAAAKARCPTKSPGRSALVGKAELMAYCVSVDTHQEFFADDVLRLAGGKVREDDDDDDDDDDASADDDGEDDDDASADNDDADADAGRPAVASGSPTVPDAKA